MKGENWLNYCNARIAETEDEIKKITSHLIKLEIYLKALKEERELFLILFEKLKKLKNGKAL